MSEIELAPMKMRLTDETRYRVAKCDRYKPDYDPKNPITGYVRAGKVYEGNSKAKTVRAMAVIYCKKSKSTRNY